MYPGAGRSRVKPAVPQPPANGTRSDGKGAALSRWAPSLHHLFLPFRHGMLSAHTGGLRGGSCSAAALPLWSTCVSST